MVLYIVRSLVNFLGPISKTQPVTSDYHYVTENTRKHKRVIEEKDWVGVKMKGDA